MSDSHQSPEETPVIACRDLCKSFEEGGQVLHVLRGVAMTIRRGDLTAVFWLEGEVLCVLASDMPAPELVDLGRGHAALARATRRFS